jgi:hypothetical protein
MRSTGLRKQWFRVGGCRFVCWQDSRVAKIRKPWFWVSPYRQVQCRSAANGPHQNRMSILHLSKQARQVSKEALTPQAKCLAGSIFESCWSAKYVYCRAPCKGTTPRWLAVREKGGLHSTGYLIANGDGGCVGQMHLVRHRLQPAAKRLLDPRCWRYGHASNGIGPHLHSMEPRPIIPHARRPSSRFAVVAVAGRRVLPSQVGWIV